MKNRENTMFLDAISKLDAATNSMGEFTILAKKIVEFPDEKTVKKFVSKYMKLVEEANSYSKITLRIIELARESIYRYFGYLKMKELYTDSVEDNDIYAGKNQDELLAELNNLVGLHEVKKQINGLIAFQKVQKMRTEYGVAPIDRTMHIAFLGNPGTGKTTVARIIGHIYKCLGVLSKGHFLEVSRTDLIAGYQGQTALKVKKVIEKALGGVLFIDEAYSITENENSDSYGRECLTELTKALEDYRHDLVVIVAGYTKPMEKFFESNPGLKSRFNSYVYFSDYSAEELMSIFDSICKKNNYCVSDSLREKLSIKFTNSVSKQKEDFSNGRFVRNLFESLIMNHAVRVSKQKTIDKDDLLMIQDWDIRSLWRSFLNPIQV